MKKSKRLLTAASVASLLLFPGAYAAADDIYGNITIIDTVVSGPAGFNWVTGNKGVPNNGTIMTNTAVVPGAGSTDNVFSNSVIIKSGGEVPVDIETHGGITLGDGDVYRNAVTIEGGGVANSAVYGGSSYGNGDVYLNDVTIEGGGVVDSSVYGGSSYGNGDVYGNTVTIKSGAEISYSNIYGGFILSGQGSVTGNTVTVDSGGYLNGYVYGGFAINFDSYDTGAVNNNKVIVRGEVTENVYGGHNNGNGEVSGNTVEIFGSAREVFGGLTSGNGTVRGNTVKVFGEVYNAYGGQYGSSNIGGDGAIGNTVEISGKVNNIAAGGYASNTADAVGNNVTIKAGGWAKEVYGAYMPTSGSGTTSAIDNTVVILDGASADEVYGGWSDGFGTVTGNTVDIYGTVNGFVYGGYNHNSTNVSDNTVYVQSTAKLSNASLFGRDEYGAGSGNRLKVNSFSGEIKEIHYFDAYDFVLGKLTDLTSITVTGGIPVEIDDTDITINFTSAFEGNNLNVGTVITVVSSINSDANPNSVVVGEVPSAFINYALNESHNNERLLLTVTGKELKEESKAPGEGLAAGLAFLTQAADLRSRVYFENILPQFTPFATGFYSSQHINTGSSVKVRGTSVLTGLAFNRVLDNDGRLALGFFFEGGWGDYDSHNSFARSASVKGSGDTDYLGGGLMARYQTSGDFYGEGSISAGRIDTDFRSHNLVPGSIAKYDVKSNYYSGHLALGQLFELKEGLDLDIYGKYLWTRQDGDTVNIKGFRFKFDDTDSHRLRAGGKLKAEVSPNLKPYVGVAFDYELDGKIKGSLEGMNLKEPSLRGGTGIGEVGLIWTPDAEKNFKVDLSVQAYTGKREGASGNLTVSLAF